MVPRVQIPARGKEQPSPSLLLRIYTCWRPRAAPVKPARTQTSAKHATPSAKPVAAPVPENFGPTELTQLQSSLTGGSALPPSTRARLEKSFATDLSDVRVHTGAPAAAATQRLNAEAFATGRDIAFAPGRFSPGSAGGDHLIAEEVAHVIQQRGGGQAVQRHAIVSNASDAAEIAASAAADRVLAGKPANLASTGYSTRGRIMRRARASTGPISPVVSVPTSGLGASKPGAVPVLTPVMTSTLSPVGGKLVDSAGRKGAKPGGRSENVAKSPDEAQSVQAETAASPANVMTAGTPAGGAATPAQSGKKTGTKSKPKKEGENAEGEQEDKAKQKEGGAAVIQARGGGRFGKIKGDRGAAAAAAAMRRLTRRSDSLAVNEGAGVRIGAAQAAAVPPSNAAEATGQQVQAAALAQSDVPSGDPETARSVARSAVASATPGDIEDLEDFASASGTSRRQPLTDAIASQAEVQTEPVRATLSAVDTPALGPAPTPAVPQPEATPAVETASPQIVQAVPPAVNAEALDASEFQAEADARLEEYDAGDETLRSAEEGPLRAIGDDKDQLNQQVSNAAGRARGTEASARDAASAALTGAEASAQGSMAGGRTRGQAEVSAVQETTRSGNESAEQTLADQITSTYQTAQTQVNQKLTSLTTDAVSSFRDRQSERLESFASGVRSDLSDLKRSRYSGIRGKARKLRDWFKSINSVPAVQQLYKRHRDQYISDIDQLINDIKSDIDQTIEQCKTALSTARTTIEQLVASNESTLSVDATAALQRAQSGFQQMEQRIQSAAVAAKNALDGERRRAIDAMDAELEKIRSENAGLVDKIANAIAAIAAALGRFMILMTRITRMGVGSFLSAALSQAKSGVQNNLWAELQEAFKQWIFMKLPALQLLLSLPPNWYEMLSALATNMIGLFTQNLPAMLPAIGAAAMLWLARTLATKLIPGVGAIMAVIDAVRGAYALVQSLFSAATAFYQFVMKVANRGNGAAEFARAIAFGIVAAVDAVLTFLGIDRLIRRVIGAIARPFARIIGRVGARFRSFRARRRQRRQRSRSRGAGARSGGRRAPTTRDRGQNGQNRRGRESSSERRRRRQQERERRRRERLDRAVRHVTPRVSSMLRRGTPSLLLRARLAAWRVRFRIRTLRMIQRGRRSKIEAANSPAIITHEWFSANREEIFRLVTRIAQQKFRSRGTPAAVNRLESIPEGTLGNTSFGGHEFGARGVNGPQHGNFVIGDVSGNRLTGRPYTGIVDGLVGGQTSPSARVVGRQIARARVSNQRIPNRGVAELGALMFGPEITRSRALGGTAEVTSRLATLGLAEGRLGIEQTFGNQPERDRMRALIRSNAGAAQGASVGQLTMPGLGVSERHDVHGPRRAVGGMLPESMIGASEAQREAQRRTGLRHDQAPSSNANARRDADEFINRTVELVSRLVDGKEYENMDSLQRDIELALSRFEALGNASR